MNLKGYTPDYNVCLICGKKTTKETCREICTKKLSILRTAIKSRVTSEKLGVKHYDANTIKIFNRLQDQLKPRG